MNRPTLDRQRRPGTSAPICGWTGAQHDQQVTRPVELPRAERSKGVGEVLSLLLGTAMKDGRLSRDPANGVNRPPVITADWRYQRMLRHTSATMTLDLYGHLYADQLDEVGERQHEAAMAAAANSGEIPRTFCGLKPCRS
jgi:hypothetical protein